MHENTGNTRRTRTSAIPSHRSARRRPPAPRGRQGAGRLTGRGFPMEDALSAGRPRRLEGHAPSRAQAQANRGTTPEAGAVAFERPAGARLPDGSVDAETDRRGDREAICRPLRSFWRLACAEGPGLELSETRAAGPRVRRRGDCRLASAA